jgi:outer membrane protein OmpA-like peptidoglycan-associated protein
MRKIPGYFIIVFIICVIWQPVFAQEKGSSMECVNNGMALENKGLYEEAIQIYTMAIDLNGTDTDAYLRRGQAYRVTKPTEPDFSMTDFDRVIAINHTHAEAYYQRGLLNAYLINNEDARTDMQTAAGLGHKGAKEWLANSLLTEPQPLLAMKKEAEPVVEQTVAKENKTDLREYLPSKSEPVIYFDLDKSNIKKNFYEMLDEVGGVLKDILPDLKIIVAGHTDSTGKERHNEKLSLTRAAAVKSYLESKHGILPERIITKGYGMNDPIDTNETEKGRAKNRRASIQIAE